MDHSLSLVLLCLSMILLFVLAFRLLGCMHDADRSDLKRRLVEIRRGDEESFESMLKVGLPKSSSFARKILMSDKVVMWVWRRVEAAKLNITVDSLVIYVVISTIFAFLSVLFINVNYIFKIMACVIPCLVVVVFIDKRIKKRMAMIEVQLPEALDLIGRSLKSGHTFASGIELVSKELDSPVRDEFAILVDEINFGGHLNDALDNLAFRLPSSEIKFFVSAVKIQSETGGKLTEIIDQISHIIRERFKLKGKVLALSAEGRYSGIVMISMPPILFLAINFLNPNYLNILYTTSVGKNLLYISVSMLVLGYVVISKMVKINV